MPSFFAFQQGSESSSRPSADTSPLLGRFRAVPGQERRRRDSVGRILQNSYGSIFGALTGGSFDEDSNDSEDEHDENGDGGGFRGRLRKKGKSWRRSMVDLWIKPQQRAVRSCLDTWWSRWGVLVVMPAGIAVAWCALPFPRYPIPEDDADSYMLQQERHNIPGHGQARVLVNFWFFLFVYYGFYNVIALMWVTKVFNIYSLNWWPRSIGFPTTVSCIALVSVLAPIPAYYAPTLQPYLTRNTSWITWTFLTMAVPVVFAFSILMSNERHVGLRQSLSETQRIFTSSWWTSDNSDMDTISRRDRRRTHMHANAFDPDTDIYVSEAVPAREDVRLRKLWIPQSFMRFIWFCLALFIGLIAYVLGETYAEIYLQTLPHSNVETIVYVYSWVLTIHLLDALTGWILGGGEGERVGSYPLGWIFKLYFSLTYQTYVRALYARLRSPQTFIILQLLSSSGLILFHPITMSSYFHTFLQIIQLNNQPYIEYQKFCGRNLFIRAISENLSMLSFLGQVTVLHFGPNKDVYPYFAFDDTDPSSGGGGIWYPFPGTPGSGNSTMPGHSPVMSDGAVYDFRLTFIASLITWMCEIIASWIVRRLVGWIYGFDVNMEGRNDVGAWPELLPTGCIVAVHVLQNMIFGIVRLEFK